MNAQMKANNNQLTESKYKRTIRISKITDLEKKFWFFPTSFPEFSCEDDGRDEKAYRTVSIPLAFLFCIGVASDVSSGWYNSQESAKNTAEMP